MSTKRTDVNELGEFGLIDHLTKKFKIHHKETLYGIGDDAAVILNGQQVTLVSTDLLVEGIHFDLMYFPLKHLGYKSIIVNLSDIYAMNGTPKQVTVSFAISNRFSVEAMEELYSGIQAACNLYKIDLIGGDTTSIKKGMVISVTAIGTVSDEKKICFRNGAKEGDIICITGDLGAAFLGLQLLEREKSLFMEDQSIQPVLEQHKYVIERQLKPEACKAAIAYFEKNKLVPTSMIDLSDGLSSDLMHICKKSNVGAFVEEGKIPIHPEAKELSLEFNMDPISAALNGGEDYELLFTIDPRDLDKIRFMPGAYIIGEITNSTEGIKLHTTGGNVHDLIAQGWKHF